jgi:spermidine synthase
VDDGRRFLRRDTRRWNLIVVDAYYADTIPFHLATAEFVRLVRSRLIPGGVVAVNVIGAMAGDTSRLLRSITRTYASAFPTVALHPVYLGRTDRVADEPRNVVLVATDAAAGRSASARRRTGIGSGSGRREPRTSVRRSVTAGSGRCGSTTCRC